jgi:formylmethanofuran dehydrogenase subunit C
MSDQVVLTLRAPLEHRLEAEAIVPDRFPALGARAIAGLPVWYGGRTAAVGDFFTVTGECSERVLVQGDLAWAVGLGAGMVGGELVIEGAAGRDTGIAMAGGVIEIRGTAGDNTGGALPGASRGMTGGEIVIRGKAGADTGARMRRGLIAVTGDAGQGTGRGMIAGTVVLFGAAGAGTGRWIKRGSIVSFGAVARPASFRYACTYRPPHIRLLLRYLAARHGLPVTDSQVAGRYHRYSGDLAELGKGEILEWAGA